MLRLATRSDGPLSIHFDPPALRSRLAFEELARDCFVEFREISGSAFVSAMKTDLSLHDRRGLRRTLLLNTMAGAGSVKGREGLKPRKPMPRIARKTMCAGVGARKGGAPGSSRGSGGTSRRPPRPPPAALRAHARERVCVHLRQGGARSVSLPASAARACGQ